jgi:hypothetical protein
VQVAQLSKQSRQLKSGEEYVPVGQSQRGKTLGWFYETADLQMSHYIPSEQVSQFGRQSGQS